MPDAYLDTISDGGWRENIKNNKWNNLIISENSRPIGTISYGKSRFEDGYNCGEIAAIYFLPEFMRKGYGSQLIANALSRMKEDGYRQVIVWCLKDNISARNFYENVGFIPSGKERTIDIGGKLLEEIEYAINMDYVRNGMVK